ncbi:MAG: hypothetical protein AABX51_01480, partial [Nanoarchaeota archaeon]
LKKTAENSFLPPFEDNENVGYSGEEALMLQCPGVEIGRHLSLRWISPKGRAGSSPVPGTSEIVLL